MKRWFSNVILKINRGQFYTNMLSDASKYLKQLHARSENLWFFFRHWGVAEHHSRNRPKMFVLTWSFQNTPIFSKSWTATHRYASKRDFHENCHIVKKFFPKFKNFFFKRNALFWATFWCTLHIDHFNTLSVRWRTVNKNFKFKKWANFKKKFFGPPGDFSSKILYPRTF